MRIAIFDYRVVETNAIGNCHRRIVENLNDEHEFVVFAVECDNPAPDKVDCVWVPAIRRPLFLLFITYHVLAPLIYWIYRLRHRVTFDKIQSVETNTLKGDILYTQFCHTAYLRDHWQETRPPGLRGWARWLDHKFHALLEPPVYRRAEHVVVPSRGLGRELQATHQADMNGEIHVIVNAVDVATMQRPPDFDRDAQRQELGFSPDDLALVFVAAGHFERKGLPLLLDAIAAVNDPHVKLLVVGGMDSTLRAFHHQADDLGLHDQVHFVGMQQDIRPYLWAADLFAFPSSYETFSLVAFEAAAAGLPLLVSHLHGVEELLREGENGWCIERETAPIAERIRYALDHRDELRTMGQHAAEGVTGYSEQAFVEDWRKFYRDLEAGRI